MLFSIHLVPSVISSTRKPVNAPTAKPNIAPTMQPLITVSKNGALRPNPLPPYPVAAGPGTKQDTECRSLLSGLEFSESPIAPCSLSFSLIFAILGPVPRTTVLLAGYSLHYGYIFFSRVDFRRLLGLVNLLQVHLYLLRSSRIVPPHLLSCFPRCILFVPYMLRLLRWRG